jgi:hypothetical protein
MKKILTYVILVLMMLSLASCSGENPPEEKEPMGRIITHEDFVSEMSKYIDLDDYDLESVERDTSFDYTYTHKENGEIADAESNFQITVDGISFAMPLTIEEFMDLGFEIISLNGETADPMVLPATARSATLVIKTPKGNTFSVYAISEDYSRVAFEDLIIMQVSCDFYEGSVKYNHGERKDAPDIQFFESITGKSTVEDVIKELKTPKTIQFTQVFDKDITTSVCMRFNFDFSNERYNGSVTIITYSVRDETIERKSYVSSISYRIPVLVDA